MLRAATAAAIPHVAPLLVPQPVVAGKATETLVPNCDAWTRQLGLEPASDEMPELFGARWK